MTLSTRIIAEAGVNHNGSLELAFDLIDVAAKSGVDYIKFQSFKADSIVNQSAAKAAYQNRNTDENEGQLEMLKRLELSSAEQVALFKRCQQKGIKFLSTPFDLESLSLLTKRFELAEIKLGSGELTNGPLLLEAGRSGANIFMSTGMGSLAEVEEALGALAFGMCCVSQPTCRQDFSDILLKPETWAILSSRVTLLHCTTDYPAKVADTNLNAMKTMQKAFGLDVGYSDHTEGKAVSLAAVALGATIIEKHFTLDRNLPGPDHSASLEPEELASLVKEVREIEAALGNGIKQPSLAEVRNRTAIRKSLVAANAVPKDHILNSDDILVKRPGNGISPMNLWDKIGTITKRPIGVDELL